MVLIRNTKYQLDFTPAQNHIRLYMDAAGNSTNDNTEVWCNNFIISDVTTEDIVDGGVGNILAFKYRIHDASIGRFLSRDPLARDYPFNSPYAFAQNRVIDGVELEGLEWSSTGKVTNLVTGSIQIVRTLKIQVVNSSEIITDANIIDDYQKAVKSAIEADYSVNGDGSMENLNIITKVEFVNEGPFTLEFVDATSDADGNYTGGYTVGDIGGTQNNTINVSITVDGNERDLNSAGRTASHEAGHTAGLKHPFHGAKETDLSGQGPLGHKTHKNNIINSLGGKDEPSHPNYNPVKSSDGHDVTPQQHKTIDKEIQNDRG